MLRRWYVIWRHGLTHPPMPPSSSGRVMHMQGLVDALQKQQAYLNYLRREIPGERLNIDDQLKTVNAALALASRREGDAMKDAWLVPWPYLVTCVLVGVAVGLGVCSVLHTRGLR